MPSIQDRTKLVGSDRQDYVLSMTSTDLGRTTVVGSTWSWLRLGIRLAISTSATSETNIQQPQLAFGMCAGTSSMYSSPTTHFVGVDLDPQFFFLHNAGTSPNFVSSGDGTNVGSTRRFVVKVGNTRNLFGSALVDSYTVYNVSGSPHRIINYIDIIKQTTGPNNTVVDPGLWLIRYYYYTANIVADYSSSLFYTGISAETASLTLGSSYSLAQQYLPVSESINGFLDTVNLYWNKADPPLELSDIAAWRFR